MEGNMMKTLTYPYLKEKIKKLRVGDKVLIQGKLLTARDAVHKKIYKGAKPPVDFKDQIIYHCGPVILEKNGRYQVSAAGPTTSIREEPYQWKIIKDLRIAGIIGKGGMGSKTLKACQEYGCVYFHAIGGAAQILADKITSIDDVHWRELGSAEAIWRLNVVGFPVVVTMDSQGNSLHDKIFKLSSDKFKDLVK